MTGIGMLGAIAARRGAVRLHRAPPSILATEVAEYGLPPPVRTHARHGGRDGSQAEALRPQLTRRSNSHRRGTLIAITPASMTTRRSFAIPRGLELGNKAGLLKLRDCAEDLANKHGRRSVLEEEVGRRCRHELNAECLEIVVTGELHRQVTGKTVRALYQDCPDAVASDAVQHGLEARTSVTGSLPLTASS